jgi:hypothetical protein
MHAERDHSPMTSMTTIALRTAQDDDQRALDRLAQLDSQRLTAGPHLVAEAEGRIIAAIGAADGRVIADPFVASADAVALLRRRLDQRTTRVGTRPGILALRLGLRTS